MGKPSIIELKYAISAGLDVILDRILRLSKVSRSMNVKLGLIEGSTILLRCSYTSRTPLESSQLVDLKYAISVG